MEPLKKAFGDLYQNLELVEADLLDEESMMKACEGSTYIVHTASPFPLDKPKDPENELYKPAVNGTMSVMKAAQANKVKRVVITSSVVAIYETKDKLTKHTFTPEDWTDIESAAPYPKSKTMAERAAWDFQA